MAAASITIFVISRTQYHLPRNHSHLRLAHQVNVEVELVWVSSGAGMPIVDGRNVGIANTDWLRTSFGDYP